MRVYQQLAAAAVVLLGPQSWCHEAIHHNHNSLDGRSSQDYLLDPSQPYGINLDRVLQELKAERQRSVSNSVSTKIINYTSNKDKILAGAEDLSSLCIQAPSQKTGFFKKSRQAATPESQECLSKLTLVTGLVTINKKLEREIAGALHLSSETVRKLPAASSFMGKKASQKWKNAQPTQRVHPWIRGEKPQGIQD